MNTDLASTDATRRREARTFSGSIFGIHWSLSIFHRGTAHEPPPDKETGGGKKWQARLWVRKDEMQGQVQEVILYGQSLSALRLCVRNWLWHEQPQWFSNVSPAETLNRARCMQQVVVRCENAPPCQGVHTPRRKERSTADRTKAEPLITADIAQRYPLVFPDPSVTPQPAQGDALPETPVAVVTDGEALYWSRDGEGVRREKAAGATGSARFDRFEDAVAFFLLHDLLPEPGPDFCEEVFFSDVECHTRVKTIHEEDNEVLINDYLSRGWFYNGQVRGKVAPHHTTGDGPLIILLYHCEPLAR